MIFDATIVSADETQRVEKTSILCVTNNIQNLRPTSKMDTEYCFYVKYKTNVRRAYVEWRVE